MVSYQIWVSYTIPYCHTNHIDIHWCLPWLVWIFVFFMTISPSYFLNGGTWMSSKTTTPFSLEAERLWRTCTSSWPHRMSPIWVRWIPLIPRSFIEQIRRGSLFLKTNQESWSKKPVEVNQKAGNDDISAMYGMIADMKSELANVGDALRRHNARHANDREFTQWKIHVDGTWINYERGYCFTTSTVGYFSLSLI